MLVANLASGMLLLGASPLAFAGAWVLLLIGAVYLAAASSFLAYVFARARP